MTCDRCFQPADQGAHGEGVCPYEKRSSTAIERDEIPGGQLFENGFDEPTMFYSHSEHRAALAASGKEIAAKNAGPHDKICHRWDVPSAATLESAKTLLSRKKSDPFAPDEAYEPIPITVTNIRFEKESA